jgi:hypothetical protein
MSTYHLFSPRAAASRLRAATGAKRRELLQREKQLTLAQIIQNETHDREWLIEHTHLIIDDYLQKQRH